MELLKERIRRDGKVKGTDVLKVDSFLNHQMDIKLFAEIGREFKRRFADCQINKILTIEASGIGIACITAQYFDCPVIFAKKSQTKNIAGEVYTAKVESFTHGRVYDIIVAKEFLGPGDRVLIIDDFLANGAALMGLSKLVEDAGTSSAPAASSTPADTADFKVGAIYINGQNDTAGYTFQHHSGITKAMENLGLDPASQLLIVDNVAEDYTAVSNAIDTLAGQGANIIFGISFGYIDAMNDKAEEYPEIIFSHATGYMGNDTNFNNYFGRIYQARYLTGVAAGLKSLEMGNNSIGYVAAYNREYAETCSGINAFALGVQAVNPDAVVHVNKISTWGDENLERQAAQALIDTYDCCVIGQHCDSAQPQLVAAENNVFGCGYNSDMTEQAPNAHLTAAIWHWDVYYQAAIETAMTCGGAENFVTEMGGNAYYAGLSEGFVDASTLNELVAAPGTAAAMEAVRELIDSGEWDVFSGVKLNITVDAEAGTAAVEQVDAPLMSDGYELKDGEVVEMANPEIVPAGGASVTDDVIKSGMNYNVAGVVEG